MPAGGRLNGKGVGAVVEVVCWCLRKDVQMDLASGCPAGVWPEVCEFSGPWASFYRFWRAAREFAGDTKPPAISTPLTSVESPRLPVVHKIPNSAKPAHPHPVIMLDKAS